MTIPINHEEYFPRIPKSEEDHSPYTGSDLISGSVNGLVDANCGSAVGEGGVDLGSFRWDRNPMEESEDILQGTLENLLQCVEQVEEERIKKNCDIYMDPCKSQYGGGFAQFYVDEFSDVRDPEKAALHIYNEKKQKNFYLEKVVILNYFSKYYYLTFWARSAESDEHLLFRALVDPLGPEKVLLCEIKDGDEMTVPAEHEEYCPREPKSEEDYSPPRSPYTWFDVVNGSADGNGVV